MMEAIMDSAWIDKWAENSNTVPHKKQSRAMDRFQAMQLFTRIVELGSFQPRRRKVRTCRASATQ